MREEQLVKARREAIDCIFTLCEAVQLSGGEFSASEFKPSCLGRDTPCYKARREAAACALSLCMAMHTAGGCCKAFSYDLTLGGFIASVASQNGIRFYSIQKYDTRSEEVAFNLNLDMPFMEFLVKTAPYGLRFQYVPTETRLQMLAERAA